LNFKSDFFDPVLFQYHFNRILRTVQIKIHLMQKAEWILVYE